MSNTETQQSTRRNSYLIPLHPINGKTRWIYIEGEFPISDVDWDMFTTILELFKPGLVQREAPAPGRPAKSGAHFPELQPEASSSIPNEEPQP